jgi:riboflavin kinase/FMN adenylyltransferase
VPQHLQKGTGTIGNFDGLHLGHKSLFGKIREVSTDGPKVAVSFYPHPASVVSNAGRVPLLTALREKVALLSHEGVDLLYLVHFTPSLAKLSANQFIDQVLVSKLNITHLVVGEDAAVGKAREGNIPFLMEELPKKGIQLTVVPHLKRDGVRPSSRHIRSLLGEGKVSEANELLGRFYTVVGRVIHGAGRGKKIGIPTANLALPRRMIPSNGVYASILSVGGAFYPAVTNVGTRPTFDGEGVSVETHVMNLDGAPADLNLYGKRVVLRFLSQVRDEKKFSGAPELVQQIRNDSEVALAVATPLLPIDRNG